ncbi:TPA: flagellar hook-length control protein FliK [Aeromonas veronii]|uniref:flagellar hook-length control protein FliK n=1 Tax=uncultured Aeromonas sp. TaxID=263763 RepID=UPI0025966610|nr:flagellar hook-length control protein FliK [uncultured Aeromonas sp.]
MMQTVLTQTPSVPANGLDKAPLNGASESNGIDMVGSESKGDFASLIAKVQGSEQGVADSNQSVNTLQSAKSLATESASPHEEPSKEQDPDADNKVEEVPATDFLLRLQDSLKLDTSLVTPQLVVAAQQSATALDGNPLPQEGEQESIGLDESALAPAASRIVRQLAGQTGAQSPLATTATLTPDTTVSPSAARVVAQGDASSSVVLSHAAFSSEEEAVAPPSDQQSGEKVSAKGEPLGVDGKPTKPLTGAERMTQLAKVLPVDESASTTKSAESLVAKKGDDSKSGSSANGVVTGKGPTAQVVTQGTVLKTFSEGLKQPDAGTVTTTAESLGMAGKGAEKRAAEVSQQTATTTVANQGSAPVMMTQSAAAQGSVTVNATTQTDSTAAPVMVAPQQVLAQAESQGPQAPLSSISAGIKQMEVTGTDEVRKAIQQELKPKVGEAEKSLVATTSNSESSQSQTVQHGQNSQPQPQVAESRAPATEATLRREPQNLPHLKLASQEAPAELHQKVNVMLAEKLQQAEIQLDPLGLGKMKIQIQIGADSQANVHFVVQHGQTREMLEQAMPRLREMLAGQGIQLGQTQVQQQSQQQQQQQQGQPTFGGQGQQGQGGGQSHAGNGLVEGELTTANLSLLVESTNGSGIDFYA